MAGKGQPGRALTLNQDVINIIASSIAMGLPIEESMRAAGKTRETYHDWMRKAKEEELNREMGLVPNPNRELHLHFLRTIEQAQAKGLRALTQQVYRDAFEEKVQEVVKEEFDAKGKLIRTTVTKTKIPPDTQKAQWILERRFRHLFSKHTVKHNVSWGESIKKLLEQGALSKEDLIAELGEDLAKKFFEEDESLELLGDGNIIDGTVE